MKTIDLVVEILTDLVEKLPPQYFPGRDYTQTPTGVAFSIKGVKLIFAIAPMMGVPEGKLGFIIKQVGINDSATNLYKDRAYDFRDPQLLNKLYDAVIKWVDFETKRPKPYLSSDLGFSGREFTIDEFE